MKTGTKLFPSLISTALIVLITGPINANADASGRELNAHDLELITNHIRSYRQIDEFDNGPMFSKVTGNSFSVTIETKKSSPPDNCPGYPTWSYDRGDGTLSVDLGDGLIFVDGWDEKFTRIFPRNGNIDTGLLYFTSFVCSRKASSNYSASNAFGVTTTVRKRKYTVIAISDQKHPTTDMVYPQTAWRDNVSGDVARRLSKSLTLRLTGTIGTWPNGENVICGTEHMKPKQDFPYDTDTSVCVFKAKTLTYEVIDRSTGEVLYKIKSERERAD